MFICGLGVSPVRFRYRTGRFGAHKSVEIDRSKPKGVVRCGDSLVLRRAGRRIDFGDRAMDLLTASNCGGLKQCFKADVNVDRRRGRSVALVTALMSVLLATGCVSFDAPPRPASLVDLERPPISHVESSDSHVTLFKSREPPVANQALSIADNNDWLFAPNDLFVATPMSVATDFDWFRIDRHLWFLQTNLLAEFETVSADSVVPVVKLTKAQPVPVDVRSTLAVPVGSPISPVVSSRILIPRQDLWQGVMKATAVGFLAFVLLVPIGCSFVAGFVCSQPQAGPRRRRARRRTSDRFLVGLRQAIANVPAH